MTIIHLLFVASVLIQVADCFYTCVSPLKEGNFTFLAQSWPGTVRNEPKGSSPVVNCTTNVENATVWLQVIDQITNRWKDYSSVPGMEKVDQIGQIFIIQKLQQLGMFLSCRGRWLNKNICLYKGVLTASQPVDVKIEIFPTGNPLLATRGERFEFSCDAPGYGSKTESYLSWHKKTSSGEVPVDKKLIKRDGYFHNGKAYDMEKIIFSSPAKSDSGIYICKRDAGTSKKSRQVELVVRDPTKPVVKLNPPGSKITVRNGGEQQVKVVCQNAGGDPRPKKEWRNPTGKVVQSCDKHSDTCTLLITKPTYEKHHGKYTCVASNSAGETRVEVMINVLLKVELQKLTTKEVAGFEDSAMLVCRVRKANPLPTMVWYFQPWSCTTTVCTPNDQEWTSNFPMVSVTPQPNIPTNESTLVVQASKLNAFYSCQATNAVGSDVYNVTLHRLANPPTKFMISKSPGDINENSTVVLSCTASVTIYREISWVKDGKSVREEPGRVKVSMTYKDFDRVLMLHFKRITLSDSGKYTCNSRMVNGTKRSITDSVFVRALKRPVIYGFESRTLNQTKKNAMIFCNASGNPLPLIEWKFRGRPISGDGIVKEVGDCSTRKQGRYFINQSGRKKLVVCDMSYKIHQGSYECSAKNQLGTTVSTMFVKIIAPPSIVRWEEKVVYRRDSSVQLFCEADGNPAPNVTIRRIKNGKQEELKNLRMYGNGSVYISFTDGKEADGRYACLAENIAGKIVKYSQMSEQGYSTYTQTKPLASSTVAAIVVCCIVFLACVLVAVFCYKRRLEKKYAPYLKPNKFFELDPDRTLFEQSSELPYDPDWEFPRDRLNFLKMIGSGAFGEVWLAEAEGILTLDPRDKTSIAAKRRSKIKRSQRYTHLHVKEKKKSALPESTGEKTLVAVKTLKGDASDTEYKDLASELKILIHIGENKQIVNLLGACTRGGKLCVVLEYCPHGSLLNFLRDRRDVFQPLWFKSEPDMSNELTNIDLTMIAYQIAKGLDFLASKRCVHRDVAARNVLIGVDYIVKVADFGLARDIYKDEFYMKSTSGLLPVKWMALESLFDKIYTSQSDV